nr:G protein-coupled receptor [Proales similis]
MSNRTDSVAIRKMSYQINISKVVIYSILFVVGATGNTFSFVTLLRLKKEQIKSHPSKARIWLLLLNLCIADLMVTFILMPLEIVWAITNAWLAGNAVCKLMMFLRTFGIYLSSFLIISITIDRYLAITRPLRLVQAYRFNKICIYGAWLLSAVSSLPQAFVFEVLAHPQDSSFEQCVTFSTLDTVPKQLAYFVYNFVGCYGAPLLVMLFCYTRILAKLAVRARNPFLMNAYSLNSNESGSSTRLLDRTGTKTQLEQSNVARSIQPAAQSSQSTPSVRASDILGQQKSRLMNQAKQKTLRLTLLIVLAFLFSWTPYYICALWNIIDRESFNQHVSLLVRNVLYSFSVSNSCFNPVVYGIFSNNLYKWRSTRMASSQTPALSSRPKHVPRRVQSR